ncbi:MAG: L-threonylcarbamoyladenylate synthase [Candidatus Gastranaerophilales bacterium]|nr:L-threonylcarbamoyladenylate synthase [Candidatus Gastranaerophilales bacterium]
MDQAYENDRIALEQVTDLDKLVEYSAKLLDENGVILTPTDTVYGLICLPTSELAIKRIFEMKERPLQRHLPVIVADWQQAEDMLPIVWNQPARRLAEAFWPGALTIACGVTENNVQWLEGRVEVGIRVPDHVYIQKLAGKMGPLFMTSANRHGEDTPHTMESALASLAGAPSLAIDGGRLSGAPSTLVNVNLPKPKVERVGSIPESEIERVIYRA